MYKNILDWKVRDKCCFSYTWV